jgi:cyclic di-GMP phosphodiesterase
MPPTRPASENVRILTTDDRPEVLRLVERTLGQRYECEFATSVAEAREKLAGATFQAALCDIQMPGESGLVLVEEIARNHPQTAIVLVTGVDDPEVAEQAFRLGAHGYLVKPFWPGQLLITTANALRQREFELAEQDRHARLLGSAKEKTEGLRHELIEAQRRAIEDLQASRQEMVERLARAIEMHDAETGRHVNRMASIVAFLGAKLGLDHHQVLLLRAAAPLHDIGKIGIPDEILHKKGPLSSDERAEMELHTTVGHQILADSESDVLRMGASIALTHHEHFDGGGYPQGLSGDRIPLAGRIAAVADVFDALLSDRSYRPALPVDGAVEAMRRGRGTHFDPQVADVLLGHRDEVLSLRG